MFYDYYRIIVSSSVLSVGGVTSAKHPKNHFLHMIQNSIFVHVSKDFVALLDLKQWNICFFLVSRDF